MKTAAGGRTAKNPQSAIRNPKFLSCVLIAVAGCAPAGGDLDKLRALRPIGERLAYVNRHRELSPAIARAIEAGYIRGGIGMTAEHVRAIYLGEPDHIKGEKFTPAGEQPGETWYFHRRRLVNNFPQHYTQIIVFRDGRVLAHHLGNGHMKPGQ